MMGNAPSGFTYDLGEGGEIRIWHRDRIATTLRGDAADRFLADLENGDPQELMARATGNYKRGNERLAKQHPRSRAR